MADTKYRHRVDMFRQRIFRVTGLFTKCAVLLLALAPVGMCQNASVPEVEQASPETVEEIIVYGEESLFQLRLEVYKAEEIVFDLFNSLNSDDEFDIHCYKEASIRSRVKRRVCRANYERELTAKATSRWLLAQQAGMGLAPAYLHPVARIKQKDKLLREEMESLVIERQDLLKALKEFSDVKQILKSERQKRCEGRRFICRQ